MFLFRSLFTGFITAGMLLVDFRDVTTANFSSKMEELVKNIKLITQQGTASKIKMDINDKQSTTSVLQLDVPKIA
jgi:ssDNA-binding replication factor A large subunit